MQATDGSHPLHLCFDYSTEYDPDVVFDKNAFCSMLLFLWNLTYIQVLIQILFFKLEIFNVLHVQIFMQQNIPWNVCENPLKCCWWLQRCFKNAELKNILAFMAMMFISISRHERYKHSLAVKCVSKPLHLIFHVHFYTVSWWLIKHLIISCKYSHRKLLF